MRAPLPWPAGRLTFDAARLPSRSYWAGSFVAHWQTGQGGVLAIRHASRPDRALWASLPGQSFAGAAHVTAAQRAGVAYTEQSIEQISEQVDGLLIAGRLSSPDGGAVTYDMRLCAAAAKDLVFTLTVGAPCNRVILTYAAGAHEQFFGFGDPASQRDRKGRRLVISAAARAAGRAAPHYLTNHLRSVFLDNTAHATFDLRQAQCMQVCLHAAQMNGHILYGEAPADLLATYAASRPARVTEGDNRTL